MLVQLSVRDIVLIDQLNIEFADGLSVLTGETGAGKSILLDALALALGARGDGGLVRSGAEQGQVVAVFEPEAGHPVHEILASNGIAADTQLLMRRVQSRDGRTRAFINDQPVSAGLLREAGRALVEIHGQHDDRALVESTAHRALVDAFGGLEADAAAVARAWAMLSKSRQDMAALKERIEKGMREAEYLRAAVAELAKLAPQPGEEEALAESRRLLMQAEKIAGDVHEAREMISGSASPLPGLANLLRRLERKSQQAPGLLDDTLRHLDAGISALYLAQDAIEAAGRRVQYDPRELERGEERLFALRAASRKFSTPVDQLPALAARMSGELAEFDSGEKRLSAAKAECARAEEEYFALAGRLSERRRQAARALEAGVDAELPALKLERASFHVAHSTDREKAGPGGIDAMEFRIVTNPGTSPGPLIKVASGGELSRILLALKVALADRGSAPTLIFDEIDSGAGGAVADAIGNRLKRLAQGVQVLAITHAPQVAAKADAHFLIAKGPAPDATSVVTDVRKADRDSRREEIARMLAGATITEEARAAADRLIGKTAA
jgi:DNA repair protein RecN (Recombination protein N)